MKEENKKKVEEATVEKDLFVNEATLELLSKRIEADVKKSFFKWIGAPIGGTGIIAIIYVLFGWIPNQLGKIIEDVPGIQNTIQVSVIDYLGNEEKGKKFIREQVNLNSERFVSKAVVDYMAGEKMESDLQRIIEEQTSSYYNSEESAKLVEQVIKSHMTSEAVRQQIREAVDKALSPVLGSLSREIKESFSSLVFDLPELAGTEQISKASLEVLLRFLGSPQATAIKNRDSPVVLTIAIGQGHYDAQIIEIYITKLQEKFKEQFKYVAIVDQEERFLALISSMPFLAALLDNSSLIDLLNGTSGSAAYTSIRAIFGETVVRRIRTQDVVRDVLRTMSLWEPSTHSEFVGVVDAMGELVGITSRSKIVDACLDEISV